MHTKIYHFCTHNVLHLYRYHFTVTSVMVKMVKFLTFNSSTNISIHALQLYVCIANVHLNSLDNIYCTFEKLFFLYIIFTVTSSFSRNGPYNVYFWKLDTHPPVVTLNNVTFVTLFSRKSDTLQPPLEWPIRFSVNSFRDSFSVNYYAPVSVASC